MRGERSSKADACAVAARRRMAGSAGDTGMFIHRDGEVGIRADPLKGQEG